MLDDTFTVYTHIKHWILTGAQVVCFSAQRSIKAPTTYMKGCLTQHLTTTETIGVSSALTFPWCL